MIMALDRAIRCGNDTSASVLTDAGFYLYKNSEGADFSAPPESPIGLSIVDRLDWFYRYYYMRVTYVFILEND